MSRLLVRSVIFGSMALAAASAQTEPPLLRAQLRDAGVALQAAVPPQGIVALIAAFGSTSVPLGTGEVLAAPFVLGLFGEGTGATVMPIPPAVAAAAGVQVQAVLLADGGALLPGMIVPIDRTIATQAVQPQEQLAAVELALIGRDVVPPEYVLTAHFTAPTNGYGLHVHAIVHHAAGTDVYLRLDTPGPGEATLNILEEHFLEVELGTDPGVEVRVLAAAAPALVTPGKEYRKLQILPTGTR